MLVPADVRCPYCDAPHEYLYYNDGKRKEQILCKVCDALFQINKRFRPPSTTYWCPHCEHALYRWKEQSLCTIYKCHNDSCPAYLKNLGALNADEKKLQKEKPSQFKLRYQYREYYFDDKLRHSKPDDDGIDLFSIHNSPNVLGLVLAFHVSFAIGARKTACILKEIFGIKISYQTVLNYAGAAAWYCHRFNLVYKGDIDNESAGDETYIKIAGKHAYTFFFISAQNRKITAYHIDDSRDTLPATIAMNEAARTAKPDQKLAFITDGNPSYPAGLHYLNAKRDPENLIEYRKVVGLQNLDEESELNRHFKQLVERLNRTYKYHIKAANGFKIKNGAICLTTLFVTHYNFLRPHMALGYNVPIPVKELGGPQNLQNKWCRIINMAANITDSMLPC